MGAVLLGIVALVLIIFLLRGFVGANPKALVKVLRYAGAAALAAFAVGLFLTERPAAGAFIASMAWGFFTRGHLWPGGWPHYGSLGRWATGRPSPSPGQTSAVRTAWLAMELDHESGEMNGTILQGTRSGGRLADLDQGALVAFYGEADDAETRRLLEAYLERRFGPGWRPAEEKKEEPPRAAAGMTRQEALKVLGLQEGATADEIRAAHRRLMLQNHPDKGGSDYLASKINEAKDFLLGD